MLTLESISIGPEAAVLTDQPGRILAVLSNAVYLESLTGYVIALVDEDAPDGPLAVRVRDFSGLLASLRGCEGLPFHVTASGLLLDGTARIDWTAATPWQPGAPRLTAGIAARTEATKCIAALVAEHGRGDGSGPVAAALEDVLSGRMPPFEGLPVAERLARALSLFATAMQNNRHPPAAQALTSLLGVGPGLTPSGDDVAAGLLAALHWHGVGPDVMLPELHREASQRTNKISARLLWHAARGTLYAPAMQLGETLLTGALADIAGEAGRLFAIGSTSGADTALGIAAGCLLSARLNHKPAL